MPEIDVETVKVGVVLLNWNGAELTIPCISSLLAGDFRPWRVLVFDNGSTDGSPDEIARTFPDALVVRNPDNIGFASGNNAGARLLLSQGADFVWILNNDTIVDKSCLGALVEECLREDGIGAATGKILYEQPSDMIWYAGGFWNRWSFTARHRGARQNDKGQYNESEDVEFISGCSMLIRSEVLAKLGLFDDRYFIYCEDAEWCLRARRSGVRMRYVPRAVLWHKVSAGMRKNAITASGGRTSPTTHYYNHRNPLFNMRRYARRPVQLGVAVLAHFSRALPLIVGLMARRRFDKLSAVVRGLRDGLLTPI